MINPSSLLQLNHSLELVLLYQVNTNITGVIRLHNETTSLYAFLKRLILHAFNYMVLTYGYFSLQSWGNDHSSQNELATPGFFKKMKAK